MSNQLKGLYAITDETLTPDATVYEQVKEALQLGVKIIQYRNKNGSDEEVEAVCRSLQALCRDNEALFIIDDRPQLAQKIGADGLHIGKDDMPIAEARSLFDGIIGVSCYNSVSKAKAAEEEGADYVAFGSFFPSPTKPQSGMAKTTTIDKAKAQLNIPICVIGGINAQNISQLMPHKPDMIAVVSALFRWQHHPKHYTT